MNEDGHSRIASPPSKCSTSGGARLRGQAPEPCEGSGEGEGTVLHVSVCVPTFRRPDMLAQCLEALCRQESEEFVYSVVVVDNDASRSAQPTVAAFQARFGNSVAYGVEPIANISLARNRAIALAEGDVIVFIDDDEIPGEAWLKGLVGAYRELSADGVLGPVIPRYEGQPPDWLTKSGLCVRRSFPTGTILRDIRDMRTGNVLFGRHLVEGRTAPFDAHSRADGGGRYGLLCTHV